MSVSIERADSEDLPKILTLVADCGLPPDGLEDHAATTLVAREPSGALIGSAALELYGADALLRSVAVRRGRRGLGLGRRMTEGALELARERGIARVYLLTETADGFFPRFGFRPTERHEVPDDVRRSVEFVSACPESARVMATDIARRGTR